MAKISVENLMTRYELLRRVAEGEKALLQLAKTENIAIPQKTKTTPLDYFQTKGYKVVKNITQTIQWVNTKGEDATKDFNGVVLEKDGKQITKIYVRGNSKLVNPWGTAVKTA
jgi:hypothetical protein